MFCNFLHVMLTAIGTREKTNSFAKCVNKNVPQDSVEKVLCKLKLSSSLPHQNKISIVFECCEAVHIDEKECFGHLRVKFAGAL